MKKTRILFSILLALVICLLPSFGAVNAEAATMVEDNAGIIQGIDIGDISRAMLNEVSDLSVDVGMVFISSVADTGRASIQSVADYYVENYLGSDAVLLVVSVGDGEWHFSTSGKGKEIMYDSAQRQTWSDIREYYISGDYTQMGISLAKSVEKYYLESENSGGVKIVQNLLIALGVGLVVGLIRGAMLKGELKSVAVATKAADCVKKGSFKLTSSRDVFLYRKVERRKIETEDKTTTTHVSESGQEHGGVGGKI